MVPPPGAKWRVVLAASSGTLNLSNGRELRERCLDTGLESGHRQPCLRPRAGSAGHTVDMARIHDVVFDCRQPASLARFWAAVLEGYAVAPYDDAELARLRSIGIEDPEDDPSVLVEGPRGQLRLWFQKVPE